MQRIVRIAVIAMAVLSLAVVASAGDKEKAGLVEVAVVQTGGLPSMTNPGVPVTVSYEIYVQNNTPETITLTRVNLQSVSPVTAYQLRNESRPYELEIASGEQGVVEYRAIAQARGGMAGSKTPVNIRGVAYFEGFSKPFTHVITDKSQSTEQ
jgi:hypothetical protein